MIKFEIRQIALIGHHDDVADVMFPNIGHQTEYSVNGAATKPLSGQWELQVKKGGAVQKQAAPMPASNGYVVRLNTLMSDTPSLKTAANAIADGSAQAALTLHSGDFNDTSAISMIDGDADYIHKNWEIGPTVTQELTNRVVFQIAVIAGQTYELTNGTTTETLANGDTVVITNADQEPPVLEYNGTGDVVVSEFDLLYDLLTNPPANRYVPTTAPAPPPHPAHAGAGVDAMGVPLANPKFPICPVGDTVP